MNKKLKYSFAFFAALAALSAVAAWRENSQVRALISNATVSQSIVKGASQSKRKWIYVVDLLDDKGATVYADLKIASLSSVDPLLVIGSKAPVLFDFQTTKYFFQNDTDTLFKGVWYYLVFSIAAGAVAATFWILSRTNKEIY